MNIFTRHPKSVGESYWQHMGTALSFAGSMLLGSAAALVHAVFPSLCTNTASRTIVRLHKRVMARKRTEVMTLLNETHAPRFADLGLDAMFRFQLFEEFINAELSREDVDLALHSGKITRAKLLQPLQARTGIGAQ